MALASFLCFCALLQIGGALRPDDDHEALTQYMTPNDMYDRAASAAGAGFNDLDAAGVKTGLDALSHYHTPLHMHERAAAAAHTPLRNHDGAAAALAHEKFAMPDVAGSHYKHEGAHNTLEDDMLENEAQMSASTGKDSQSSQVGIAVGPGHLEKVAPVSFTELQSQHTEVQGRLDSKMREHSVNSLMQMLSSGEKDMAKFKEDIETFRLTSEAIKKDMPPLTAAVQLKATSLNKAEEDAQFDNLEKQTKHIVSWFAQLKELRTQRDLLKNKKDAAESVYRQLLQSKPE